MRLQARRTQKPLAARPRDRARDPPSLASLRAQAPERRAIENRPLEADPERDEFRGEVEHRLERGHLVGVLDRLPKADVVHRAGGAVDPDEIAKVAAQGADSRRKALTARDEPRFDDVRL